MVPFLMRRTARLERAVALEMLQLECRSWRSRTALAQIEVAIALRAAPDPAPSSNVGVAHIARPATFAVLLHGCGADVATWPVVVRVPHAVFWLWHLPSLAVEVQREAINQRQLPFSCPQHLMSWCFPLEKPRFCSGPIHNRCRRAANFPPALRILTVDHELAIHISHGLSNLRDLVPRSPIRRFVHPKLHLDGSRI